ncbi:tRNA methyltransferase 10 homolog A [Galendromus occidentalis]|uniref:tRNA (guanine(9)-N(1))-methyltransferase n=1 Tax=Galendromus occidentalis TaxID=34638 RepID=A0AAJ6QYE1_9ACAR|nr:tRNA methyltransferase 10 homolog A [Galendromus occidentalis]
MAGKVETAREEGTAVENSLLIKGSLDIEATLRDSDLPEKDRLKLKTLRDQLLAQDIAKHRRKKLWKEVDWVINRKRRNDQKKQERKKRRLEIRTGVREPSQKRAKIVRMADSDCKIKVALDLSLHDLMTEAERTKTGKQVQRCYAINRRMEQPLRLYLTGLRDAEAMTKNLFGFENWDVFRAEDDHVSHFGKEKVVYLTGDSEVELEDFSEDEAYVIGAMVDHNRHKGLTLKRAIEAGIRHARLPLDKYVDMKSRKVLTIDHCFQIVLNRANGLSWQESIMRAIPARKGAQLKDDDGNEGVDENEKEHDHADDSDPDLGKESDDECHGSS